MKVIFHDADRRAIDIVLDRAATLTGSAGISAQFAPTDGQLHRRVSQVEKLLSLLDEHVVGDPPKDLLRNTLRHIAKASGRERTDAALLADQPPVA